VFSAQKSQGLNLDWLEICPLDAMEGLTPDAGVAELVYEAEDASVERCKILQTFGGFSGDADFQGYNAFVEWIIYVPVTVSFGFVTLLPIPVVQILLLMEKH
jgi:hypothetical protein